MNNNIEDPEKFGFNLKRLELIKKSMQGYVDRKQIAGLNTAVMRKGKVIFFEQTGFSDIESQKKMSGDSIFRIYSMTKPIICTALMILYEEGKFHLFDPVSKFLPSFSKLKILEMNENGGRNEVDLLRPITICDLMTHTAGFTYDFFDDSPVCDIYRQAGLMNNSERTLEELVKELTYIPLAYQPGTKWHYSISIDIVAHLVEILSAKSIADFLYEKLFIPLGMSDTKFYIPEEKKDRLATMYGLPDIAAPDMTLGKLQKAWLAGYNERIDVSKTYPAEYSNNFARGGHGLFSTVGDYLIFTQMLLNQGEYEGKRILGRKTVELMHMNYLKPDLLPYKVTGAPAYGYGFGLGSRVLLNVAESKMPGSVGEFGWSGAATTYYWIDPKEELIGILMSQSMMCIDIPEKDFQLLTYQALD